MSEEGKQYERSVFKVLDIFGQAGGCLDFLNFVGSIIVYLVCASHLDVMHLKVLKESTYENKHKLFINKMISEIHTFKFICKLHIYSTLCCRNRVAKKILVDDNKKFSEQYEFFEDMHDNFGNFFAATNYMN